MQGMVIFFGEGTIYNAQKLVRDKAYTSRRIGTGDLGSRKLAWETVFGSKQFLAERPPGSLAEDFIFLRVPIY